MTASKKDEYSKIRAVWYDILKKDGFDDIEQDENNLKVWSSDKFGRKKGLVQNGGWQSKADYYRMADWFTNDYKFKNKLERTIWTEHAKGTSIVEITKLLKAKRIKTNRDKVWKTIRTLENKMKTMYLVGSNEDET